MFGSLTEKLHNTFRNLSGKGKISESNIADAVSEVRLALLEADVNYGVAKTLIKRVKEKALGDTVLKSLSPGQQFIKIIHDELISLMGSEEGKLQLKGDKPKVIMVCGLQGSGKTTHCVKIAHFLKKQGQAKNPLVIAADLQRPAAVLQLKTLAEKAGISSFALEGETDPVKVAKQGLEKAKTAGHDIVIVDTAGRLHIDEELMKELKKIKDVTNPSDVLFVANSTLGQDAVKTAAEFNLQIEITGTVLTMLDGNARAGAAISIREVTGKPFLFEGIGEKIEDIQVFNPASMADRILGMGDTINLAKKAQEHFDEEKGKELEEKLRTASFTFDDYLQQMQMIKKMGSIKKLLGMLPGIGSKMDLLDASEEKFKVVEAMIQSMTKKERKMDKLSMDRRRRIAKGSGLDLDEVNRLIKGFEQAKKMMKNLPNMKQLEKLMGGFSWR